MMATGAFVVIYALIACGVGWIYFTSRQWPEFFERHAIGHSARDSLTLHLVIGAAAVGAAWPVAVIYALYGAYMTFARRLTGREAERANV